MSHRKRNAAAQPRQRQLRAKDPTARTPLVPRSPSFGASRYRVVYLTTRDPGDVRSAAAEQAARQRQQQPTRPWLTGGGYGGGYGEKSRNKYGPTYQWSPAAVKYMYTGTFSSPRHRATPKLQMTRLSKGSPETRMFADLFVRGTIHAAA